MKVFIVTGCACFSNSEERHIIRVFLHKEDAQEYINKNKNSIYTLLDYEEYDVD